MYDETSPTAVWTKLRATRHAPPGSAGKNKTRAKTYVSALEQAEQMFRAASVVGPATRPLLLFYGLSQAGRAVAAVATVLERNEWQLKSHGIKSQGLTNDLSQVEVCALESEKQGSFVKLSELLDSPLWSGALPLHQLWDTLPQNREWPIVAASDIQHRLTALRAEAQYYAELTYPHLNVLVFGFPSQFVQSAPSYDDLEAYLAHYPNTADSSTHFTRHPDGSADLFLSWTADGSGTEEERRAQFEAKTYLYRGNRWFFPDVTGCDKPLHPFMAWWAVLHALSMLARYEPAKWIRHIDVDTSPHAVAIEHLLATALEVVPALIADTISEASGPLPTSNETKTETRATADQPE